MHERQRIRGYARVQLVNVKTGKVEGDTCKKGCKGDCLCNPNTVTQIGFQDYLCKLLGNLSGSKQATVLALGTQTAAPSSTQTDIAGEFGGRKSASNSVVSSQTMRMTAQWGTSEATESDLGGIGAYNTTSGGSVMNVRTFATSAKTTDQSLNATMNFAFS